MSVTCNYLFVYGTLKKGEVNHHHWLAPYIRLPLPRPQPPSAAGEDGGKNTSGGKSSSAAARGADAVNHCNNNNSEQQSGCCDCHLLFVGKARTLKRYPFFTNVGVGGKGANGTAASTQSPSAFSSSSSSIEYVGGTCAPCVVDAAIHDDDLASKSIFVPKPPEWQGCAATVDDVYMAEKKKRMVGGGGGESAVAVKPSSPSAASAAAPPTHTPQQQTVLASGPQNGYYNIFPQRVHGEVYRVVRCAACLGRGRRAGARLFSKVDPLTMGELKTVMDGGDVKQINSNRRGVGAGDDEEDCSLMLSDFDELECTRQGVYTRRPVEIELLVRGERERETAERAMFVNSGTGASHGPKSALPEMTNPFSSVGAAANNAANRHDTTATVAPTVANPQSPTTGWRASLSQKFQSALHSGAATILGATSHPTNAPPTSTAMNDTVIGIGGNASSNTTSSVTDIPYAANLPLVADIYFRTDKYPRSQLIAMLHRCLNGPARAKLEANVEPLITPEEKEEEEEEEDGEQKASESAASGGMEKEETRNIPQKQHIQGFLSNFSVVKSLALSYPAHFSYTPPHLRPASSSASSSLQNSSTPPSSQQVADLLRRLPPSILKSVGVLPAPMLLVILDGMGDFSGYSPRMAITDADQCKDGYGKAGGGEGGGGEEGGHGACLPTQAYQTQFNALPSALKKKETRSNATAIFSPLELSNLLHSPFSPASGSGEESGRAFSSSHSSLSIRDAEGLHLITRNGYSGVMDSGSRAGLACGSDTAHLSLLGFDPRIYYRGRGSFETIGSGLMMKSGDIAFKCNFATMAHNYEKEDNASNANGGDDDGALNTTSDGFVYSATNTPIVVNRRADREFTREGPILCEALNGIVIDKDLDGKPFRLAGSGTNDATAAASSGAMAGGDSALLRSLLFPDTTKKDHLSPPLSYQILVKYATEHRCGVVIRGPHLSDSITGTDPLVNSKPLVWCTPVVGSGAAAAKPSQDVLETQVFSKFLQKPCTAADVNSSNGDHRSSAAAFTIVDPKTGLPLSDAQKESLIATYEALWLPYNSAVLTSKVVNAASAAMTRALMHHPINIEERLPLNKPLANVVLLRGAAQLSEKMPSFALRHGLSNPVAVAPTAIIKGLCKTAGFKMLGDTSAAASAPSSSTADTDTHDNSDPFTRPIVGITGSYDSNLGNKAKAVVAYMQRQQDTFRRLFEEAFGRKHNDLSENHDPTYDEGTDADAERRNQIALLDVERLIQSIRAAERKRILSVAPPTSMLMMPRRKKQIAAQQPKKTSPSTASSSASSDSSSSASDDDSDDDAREQNEGRNTTVVNMAMDGGEADEAEEETELQSVSVFTPKLFCGLQKLADFVTHQMSDFLFLHVKGTDDAGHDKDLPKRVAMAAKAGEEVVRYVWDHCPMGTTIAITADHSTPVTFGDHSTESVPFSVAKKRWTTIKGVSKDGAAINTAVSDGTPFFTEASCEVYGSLGRFHGKRMLEVMLGVHDE